MKPILAILLLATPVLACLWDNDTLRDEQRGLPAIADLLAGKFERHSTFFYQDRIRRMEARIATDRKDLAAYDNLAVAYDKLGQYDKAIETILKKDAVKPGEYTTHANLGTFYLHAGDVENGVTHIRRAIEINPDAHFGREDVQLRLAEFYLRAKSKPAVLETENFLGHAFPERRFRPTPINPTDFGLRKDPIEGIAGILRFGAGTNPELYYVLGELLAMRGDKHLAYRAFKRALELNHPRAEHVRAALEDVKGYVEKQHDLSDEAIAAERRAAEEWVARFQAFEDRLIREGKDPDANPALLAAFYDAHGKAGATPAWRLDPRSKQGQVILAIVGVVGLGGCIVVRDLRRWRRRRRMFARG